MTAWNANKRLSQSEWGTSIATVVVAVPRPKKKQAPINKANASVFNKLVTSCTRPETLTPRICKSAKSTVTNTANDFAAPDKEGISNDKYSPITKAAAAVEPQVESQSLQPTTKPA